VKLLNDEPTLKDLLGRAPLVSQLAGAVAGCDPPQVFGLHGDWGAGKTSFLYQLQWQLVGKCPNTSEVRGVLAGLNKGEHRNKTTVVWFEAWRYQHEQAPIIALLHEIRSQLPWTSRTLNSVKKLTSVTVRSALLSLEDLTKRIGIQASKIQDVGEKWEADNLATQLPAHQIRHHLEHTLASLLPGEPGHRLVIIVDDLDRCEAETAYRLLEGIKIYLNLPNCVFVLGMNQRILEGAVGQHLPEVIKDDKERRRVAKRYLEKLCQNVWHLPLAQNPAQLLDHYLGTLPRKQSITRVVADHDCLPPVPRKIKGFANLLLRSQSYLDECHGALKTAPDTFRWAKVAVFFCYLYHFHNELYRVLSHRSGFYDELLGWCRGTATRATGFFDALGLDHREVLRSTDQGETTGTIEEIYDPVYADPATDRVLHIEALVKALGPLSTSELMLRRLETRLDGGGA
jgi:hypothetical protein